MNWSSATSPATRASSAHATPRAFTRRCHERITYARAKICKWNNKKGRDLHLIIVRSTLLLEILFAQRRFINRGCSRFGRDNGNECRAPSIPSKIRGSTIDEPRIPPGASKHGVAKYPTRVGRCYPENCQQRLTFDRRATWNGITFGACIDEPARRATNNTRSVERIELETRRIERRQRLNHEDVGKGRKNSFPRSSLPGFTARV